MDVNAYLGTYAEFILPVLIVAGLFTGLAALGMSGFIGVMSFVDINCHGAEARTICAFFDRFHDSTIAGQRFLWAFPLIVLVVKGAGAVSLDGQLRRWLKSE